MSEKLENKNRRATVGDQLHIELYTLEQRSHENLCRTITLSGLVRNGRT